MRIGLHAVDAGLRMARALLLVVPSLMALAGGPVRADLIIDNEGSGTAQLSPSIERYRDGGKLLWSTPVQVYSNNSGITTDVSTGTMVSADGSTIYSTVWTKDSSGAYNGGEVMVLDALTGAVNRVVPLAGNGFDRPYAIAAAPDGGFYLEALYPASDPGSAVVKLDANFNLVKTGWKPLNLSSGLTVDNLGNPIASCCHSGATQVVKYRGSDISIPGFKTTLSVGSEVGRGVRWYNGALYMAVNGGQITTATGACNYQDRVVRFTTDLNQDPNGVVLYYKDTVATLLTPCAGSTTPGAGFTDVTQDGDGNFWVSEYYTSSVAKYSSTGAFLGTFSGLNRPNVVEWVAPLYAPEPASMAVLGVGVAGLIGLRRRAKR